MSYTPLGQTLTALKFSAASPSAPSTQKSSVVVTSGSAAKPAVVVSAVAKPVDSSHRSKAAVAMAIRIADKIRALRSSAPAGAPRSAMTKAENDVRQIALLMPLRRMTITQAFVAVSEAQRNVVQGQLPAETRKKLLSMLQALRSSLAPPVRSKVTVVPTVSVKVTATQATTIQAATDAAISKLAATGTPVTEATVKQTAVEIIREVAPDSSEASKMEQALKGSPLVVSGEAKTDETRLTETLTSTPLSLQSVASLVESSDKAPPAPEPEAEKKDEPAAPPPTPDDLVAAPPPADKKADEVTSLVASAEPAAKEGLFGIPWLYVGLGAGAMVIGGIIMSRRPAPTPNRRKRRSR